MDKKNMDTTLERPSFFEVFKTQCSESDLGPISINWFDELSSETSLCDLENSDNLDYITSGVNQNTFKTPKRKLSTNTQLASTPMIFKDQNKILPQFASALKELDQSKGGAGRCHQPIDSVDTSLDQSDLIVGSFNTCLLPSPPNLRKKCKTPPSNKCVLSESLLCTPRLFEVQTQKCISESLGVEVDPEMSWSSSLATPPTLSPTVLIARGNDTVSGTKPHDERITLIMHNLFTKYCGSPAKNCVNVQSTTGVEDVHTKVDKITNYERPTDDFFDVSRVPRKSSVNLKPLKDEDLGDIGSDSGISVSLACGKAFQRKVKTVKSSQKKSFEVEQEGPEEAIKDSEEFCITESERQTNNCKCNPQGAIIYNNRMQTFREDQNDLHMEKEMPSSTLSPWSQLDLSGLEITQLEKVSLCCSGGSSILNVEKSSEERASSTNNVCTVTSPLESCMINTADLIKTENLINTCSLEKLPVLEDSSVPITVTKKSSSPGKVCKDEHAFVKNVSETGSLLIENATSTDASNTYSSCFHKHSKENSKISSGPPINNGLTPVGTNDRDPTKSDLSTRKSLSNLKKRPQKFVYVINNTPSRQEERTKQKNGSSAFHESSYTDFKSCIAEESEAARRSEGKTEETLNSRKNIIEEKQGVGAEKTGLSLFPQTEKEKLSKAANQEIRPCEQRHFATDSKDILEKNNGEKDTLPPHLISLPEASQIKTKNNQEVLELDKQHSFPRGDLMAELWNLTNKSAAPAVLKENVDLRQSVPLDLKENVEDRKPRFLGSASSRKIQGFDGFKTASNKNIAVSDLNIGKGKLLFKDIEDEFLEDFPTKRVQNISNNNLQTTENDFIVGNNLNRKKSSNLLQVSEFQMNFNKCSSSQNIFPEYANQFFQNVSKNLTASQEAEVTELSHILEETGSQFEFTQFKEQKTMLYNNNNLEVSEKIDKSEISKLDLNSDMCKDIDSDECIRTNVQQSNYLSPKRLINTTEEYEAQRQSWEKLAPINSLIGKLKKAHFAPSVSAPLQPHLSDLGEGCSIVNTEVNLSDEITTKAPAAVSRMGEMLNPHKMYFQCGLSKRSSNSWNNSRCMKGIDGHQRVKEVNAEYVLKNNASDTITFVKENISKDTNVNENVVHISRTTEVNLKIVEKYSLHLTRNQLSSIENNRSILVSHHFANCDETQCKYNLQDSLSDLTCLAEVTKTENNYLTDAFKKENINSNQDQEKMNNFGNADSLQNVHTGVDGSVFAEKSNTLHLLADPCQREDLDNILSSEKAGVSNRKGDTISVRKSIDLNQNEINSQEGRDIKKRKNSAMGFYTASGKRVIVSDESLAIARHLLSEEKEDTLGNLLKPVNQAPEKKNKDEKINKMRGELGGRTEKHWEEFLNSQSDFEDSLTANPETKNNGTCESSKNEISKMLLIDTDKDEHYHDKDWPSINENVHNLSLRNTRSTLHDACNEKISVSDTFIPVSQEASSKSVNVEKNLSSFENISENESREAQKCDLKSLDAHILPKTSPGQTEAATPKLLKSGPITFTTASGKTVGVSQDALTKTKELFNSNYCKPTKHNTESQSEIRKHNTLNSCRDVMGSRNCAYSTNCSSVENSVASQIPRMRDGCCEDKHALPYSRPVSLDHGPESSSGFQMEAEHSNTWISNKLNNTNAGISTANSGFFSTASGKPVKISEESLRKSKLLFSEIENNSSSEYQSSVLDCNYASDTALVRDKVTSQKNQLPFQGKTSVNFGVNTNISCGFSTASGKQVEISEKAFQKAKEVMKEFDDIASNCHSEDKHVLRPGHISPVKPTEPDDEIVSKPELQEKCNADTLTSKCTEKREEISSRVPKFVSHPEKCRRATEQEHDLPSGKEIEPLEMNLLSSNERKCAAECSAAAKVKLNLHSPTYSQIRDNYLETEAAESAKAFMQDDELTDTEVQKYSLVCGKTSNFRLNTRTGKRQMEEQHTFGEPPIKRKLLPEFDRSERPNNSSFKILKTTPDVHDRRKFTYDTSLKPVICDPFRKPLIEESRKKENYVITKKPVKVFVPPFKTKLCVSEEKMGNNKECVLLASKNIDGGEELNSAKFPTATTKLENEVLEKDTATQISAVNFKDEDLTKNLENLHNARNLQEIRILKKKRQRIHPQPGSLYLMKMAAAACRIPFKDAVEDKSPTSYSSEQLYSLGVSKQCLQVNSRNAEDFQFLMQEFFGQKYLPENHGLLLGDGGYLIPTNEGKAGKEEFYQALCDTPGVDPKLISKSWVYNHYRWIVWKLAAMEVAFPQEFANKCLTPERVLLQLKYRYDVEVDRSHRSAIKRITERDDVAAKTLILCISKIISLNIKTSHVCDNKNIVEESPPKAAIVEVTDGWYGIRAILDPPLQSLLCKDKLAVGHKIIVHGAELMGPQDACAPLEAPETLTLKISANSTRRTQWYSKLGYHWDPRPFCVPLSSLLSDGGTVSCIDVIVHRVYPIQWMEKISMGSYVFRNSRAEEREATKHAENRQKILEALLTKIQAEFEKSEGERKRSVRSRTLTRQQIRSLHDGAELYEAVMNAADPVYMEGYFSSEQLKALNSHRQMANEQRQARIEAEFRKAVESAEQDEHSCCKRDTIPILKLRIMDYRKEERCKEVILNIWRPSSHVCTVLKEGGRYKIFHLTASQSKDRSETANFQLTATKKTQYLQLPVSQEVLSHVYKPRQCLYFSRLLEPSFQPHCSEVDLVGFIVCLRKGTGFSTLLYLSDENQNLIAVQINSDLKLLAIEDIIIPSTLISATNLQWRHEFRSYIPTLFAGERSAFSSNPKESHLQEAFNELRNVVENDSCFGKEVQQRLMDLLPTDSPQGFNLPQKCGVDSFPSPWKSGSGNKNMVSTSGNDHNKHLSSLTLGRLDPKPLVSLSSTKVTQELQETPKNYKKRKAIELLKQVPSPPPVKPICTLVSPLVKRAFQPPRSSALQHERPLGAKYCQSIKKPALKMARETGFPFENNFVADEELAMINTQTLLTNLPEDKEGISADQMEYSGRGDLPDRPLRKNNS